MREIKVLIATLILVMNLFSGADAQTGAQPNNAAAPSAEVTALIPVADTSPSVKKQLGDIKQCAKELISIAPPGTRTGIVGINWEATKKLFKDASEADAAIDSLAVGGNYSDLGRGNDAALSLIQEAGASRAAVVFLTDGKATVPTTFKNRETFIQMLRREYAARLNIRVFVVNVKGEPLPADANLPPNVTFVAAKDWAAARDVIAKELAPQIITQLAPEKKNETPNTPASPTTAESDNNEEQSGLAGLFAVLVGLAVVSVIILPFYFWLARNRRQPDDATTEVDEPENALRQEEITSAELPPTASSEPVLILQAERRRTPSQTETSRNAAIHRAFVRAGERLTIGNSRFSAGLELPGSKQAQSLEVAFDGTQATVFRLRPAANESQETVTFNEGENAPAKFVLRSDETFCVGDFEINSTLGDENVVELLATAPRTDGAMMTATTEANGKPQLRGGRRMRRGGVG